MHCKFLHSIGAKKFDWPREEMALPRNVTLMSMELKGDGPFEISDTLRSLKWSYPRAKRKRNGCI